MFGTSWKRDLDVDEEAEHMNRNFFEIYAMHSMRDRHVKRQKETEGNGPKQRENKQKLLQTQYDMYKDKERQTGQSTKAANRLTQ